MMRGVNNQKWLMFQSMGFENSDLETQKMPTGSVQSQGNEVLEGHTLQNPLFPTFQVHRHMHTHEQAQVSTNAHMSIETWGRRYTDAHADTMCTRTHRTEKVSNLRQGSCPPRTLFLT